MDDTPPTAGTTAENATAPGSAGTPVTALGQLNRAHVLFLNWRDPSHPQAGGAEAYCYEIARRFARAGAHVTLFAARHPGSPPETVTDGVRIVRAGGTFGVYAAAARHLTRHRHAYDAVIDFQNGIPFFSPLFTPRWTADICVIHHVHQHQFDIRFPWPANVLGRVLEKQLSRRVYRGRPLVVVSPSTREGARRELGFDNPIYIVPNGGPPPAGTHTSRSRTPAITVVSRLVPQKRVDLLVRALPELTRRFPDLHVDICGDGEELAPLRTLADRTGTSGCVDFHGRVTDERRQELLSRAWLTVVPSVAEGWGLTVIEANGVGTPAVAYDVPGLRDAVQHGRNGWLLPAESDLAQGVAGALEDLREPTARERTAERCRAWSAAFSWDRSAERLAAVAAEEMRRVDRHRRSRRRPSDLAVAARFRTSDADAMEHALGSHLRQTDSWSRHGDTFRLLLHGCDEVRAARVLRRLGVDRTPLTLAHRQEILTGQGEGPG
ncbi:glycosyltransferase family 4 protein [Streptomyces ficellus]|uniref:D-inositol 3-phosphate glycosyltransferase n=1 Tax=Streptomyces ficellus TaxID=1977088 RepID=A0A6I6F217_9ACTN|nr:glycosyltransferase family 4 protein [Streptomyces ficellus]QGV78003.1 glycosyltransferase family 1 protein [Streptomyces ficellus]